MRLVGIDLGTRKIALALFEDQELVHTFAHTSDAPKRDLALHELSTFAHGFAESHHADSVWVEDTIVGNNRKYSIQLAEAKGAVLAGLALRRMEGCDIQLVDNKAWKKQVVGNGNASKEQVKDYIDVTYPAYAPLCGDDQDLYDAACIGRYGLDILARAEDLQLSDSSAD